MPEPRISDGRWFRGLLLTLFVGSGAAGLGYQAVWTRMLGVGFGHEQPALLAVITAFMGGMALGAWLLDGPIHRSRRAAHWYAGLEFTIGLWAMLSPLLIDALNHAARQLLGPAPSPWWHWSVSLVLPATVLLPATAAMGATLPAMERFLSQTGQSRCLGAIYGANTFGAAAGVLLATFWMAPALGFRATAWCLAGVNLACGIAALLLGRAVSAPVLDPSIILEKPTARDEDREQITREILPLTGDKTSREPLAAAISPVRLMLFVLLTGWLGIGFEVVGVRALSNVLEGTIYTFALALAVYLVGTAAGAALYQRFAKHARPERLLADLTGGLALACMIGLAAIARSIALYDGCRSMLGNGELAGSIAEAVTAAAVFALPALLMGATFSHLVQLAKGPSGGIGRAAALNTLGGAFAAPAFNVLLLPALGMKWTLAFIAASYLILLPTLKRYRWLWLIPVLACLMTVPGQIRLVRLAPDERLLEFRDGILASVAVVEDRQTNRTLRVDNRYQMGGTAAAAAQYRQAHLPLLLHPAPRNVLMLGLGTGITLGAARLYPGLEADGVELVPEVLAVQHWFASHTFEQQSAGAFRLYACDARRFVRCGSQRYDVIIADLFHPARDGAGFLYTVEHFSALRERLNEQGLCCQWLPLHQLDEATLRVIVRSFLEVFPNATGWLLHFNIETPVLGLMGGTGARRYTPTWMEQRSLPPALAAQLKGLALADSVRLFGQCLFGSDDLHRLAVRAGRNTDDRPAVIFNAPRFVHAPRSAPYELLLNLMNRPASNLGAVLSFADTDAAQWLARADRFRQARDVYLTGMIEDAEGRRSQAMDRYVDSARLSEDFTAGYAQCLTLASLIARDNPAEARRLLERLIDAQPSRPVARDLLKRLFPEE